MTSTRPYGPGADWRQDAMFLREAADVLEARAARRTFALRVIVRVLRRTANGLVRGER